MRGNANEGARVFAITMAMAQMLNGTALVSSYLAILPPKHRCRSIPVLGHLTTSLFGEKSLSERRSTFIVSPPDFHECFVLDEVRWPHPATFIVRMLLYGRCTTTSPHVSGGGR